jgi:outer membrane receptor protein involved in Fe transport
MTGAVRGAVGQAPGAARHRAVLALALAAAAVPARGAPLRGVVVDATGAPVSGARVDLLPAPPAAAADVATASDGSFELHGPPGPARLRVAAGGFAALAVEVVLPVEGLRLVLRPAGLTEVVTVTASRGTETGTPAAVSVLSAAELLGRAPGGVDDALRHTPGFSLFRRSSARVANPTTQGVTLRGVSGSGASRTLVLADGLPLNDPFGSWVYWNRIPLVALERVEVVRGGGGDLYGADALGGVIQLLTLESRDPRLRVSAEAGAHDSGRASGYASGRAGGWSGEAAGEWARGGDVFVVAQDDRGGVDVPAGVEHWSGFAALGYQGGGWRGRLKASAASEERANGTPLQRNDTDWRRFSAELSGFVAGGVVRVLAAAGAQTYRQSFSAVSDDRASERLTARQRVPAHVASASAQWTRPLGPHALLVGVEARRVRATVEQTRFSFTGDASGPFLTGGLERTASAFARARLQAPGSLSFVLAGRFDAWRSEPREAGGAARNLGFVSPRLAVEWRPPGRLAAWAAATTARRTPTQNELFRGFRVGSVVTGANPELTPERLTSGELGVSWSGARGSARVTGFVSRLEDAIANVTLAADPELILRERRNAGAVDAHGLELELDFRPHRALRLCAFAAATSSRFRGTPELPELAGNRVPQVPRVHLGASADWSAPFELDLSAQLRHTGEQLDDDRNELALRAFSVVDVAVTRPVGGGLQAFAAVENLLDAEYDVARTPTRSVGWPRTWRAGLRLFLP